MPKINGQKADQSDFQKVFHYIRALNNGFTETDEITKQDIFKLMDRNNNEMIDYRDKLRLPKTNFDDVARILKKHGIGVQAGLLKISRDNPNILQTFARMASLNQSHLPQEWASIVEAYYIDLVKTNPPPEAAMQAVIKAMDYFSIVYQKYDSGWLLNPLKTPDKVVETHSGDCRDTSLLAAASLAFLGFEAALLLTTEHVIPVLIVRDAKQRTKNMLPFPKSPNTNTAETADQRKFLLPFETTSTNDHNVGDAISSGKNFFQREHNGYGSIIIDLDGNSLWIGGGASLAAAVCLYKEKLW